MRTLIIVNAIVVKTDLYTEKIEDLFLFINDFNNLEEYEVIQKIKNYIKYNSDIFHDDIKDVSNITFKAVDTIN